MDTCRRRYDRAKGFMRSKLIMLKGLGGEEEEVVEFPGVDVGEGGVGEAADLVALAGDVDGDGGGAIGGDGSGGG